MVDSSLSIDGLRGKVGVEWESGIYEIEKGMIRRFVQATGDTNPLWQDEEYAKKRKYGSTIAPPAFILTIGFEELQEMLTSVLPGAILHGSTELECYQPLRPGDVVTATTKITNIRERQGKMGKTVFVAFDITYKNQRQQPVAKCRQMVIVY